MGTYLLKGVAAVDSDRVDTTCHVAPDAIKVSARRLQNGSERRLDACEHVPFLPDAVPHGRKCGAGVCA